MSSSFTESIVEEAALAWLKAQGWAIIHGPDIAPDMLGAERTDYGQVVLEGRLRDALAQLNPKLPQDALEDAFHKLMLPEGPTLEARNRALHRMLVDGVTVEFHREDGSIGGAQVQVLDFSTPANNDWLAVNQYTVVENKHKRRPDVVLFINGLPLVLIELKNAADENATIWTAFNQIQTYKAELPTLFAYNALLIISDGMKARIGTLTAGKEWFKPWRTIHGEEVAPETLLELQVMIEGVFEQRRLLDLLGHFLIFEDDGSGALIKKMAGYHQFHAVNIALGETLRAARTAEADLAAETAGRYESGKHAGGAPGDRRIGVVWHTQGSGKSLSMAFYAGRIIREPAMANPTVMVLTDRNDLDDQLFGTFSRCKDLLRQPPVQAESRADLREKLSVEAGGVVFTTIQKFLPSPQTPLPKGEGIKNSQPEDVDIHSSPLGRGDGGEGTTDSTTYRGGLDYAGLTSLARELRRTQTPAEEMLWQFLRDRRLKGAKFRRQHQYGLYILDFFCPEAQVAVECDGASHNTAEQSAQDHARDAYLHNQGVTVLRFSNTEVINDTEAVLSKIAKSLTPDPSPNRRGENNTSSITSDPSPTGRGDGGEGPVLSYRHNIIVIADEAHRSQYDFIDGFARHMRDALPNASFIGFTGTPIELVDANTRAVFGDYISVYDIQRAVSDKATVPIYYESRLAKLELSEDEKPKIDPKFDEVTEGEETNRKEKLKSKWAQLEAVVGTEKRLKLLARDIVAHYEQRLEALEGKAMVVCMSRRICVDLYKEIVALRPDWEDEDDTKGVIKVIMTGSATDPVDWQKYVRNKKSREELANRFRTATDPFRMVLVRDMWLTGFDAPCLHTMYVDKPMRGHGLMQAIARVNRVFRDKPGGLVVDYLGLAQELKQALATYTESGGTGKTAIDQNEAVAILMEKYEVCCTMFYGFDWSKWVSGTPQERLQLLPLAQQHILSQEDGKSRLLANVRDLSQAFALSVPHPEALVIRDDVAFFQAVRTSLSKKAPGEERTEEELDLAVRQIVSRAVSSEEVIDIFSAAGLKKPDISILSDEFLAEVKGMPHRNLAVELLQKLLKGEIRTRSKKNVVQSRSFLEMLENTLRRYQNRAIEAAQVIEELIRLAKEMREANARGEALGLTDDEVAFYDALETNDSAVKVLGDETLRTIARELVETVRRNVTIDWTLRENVRAQLRVVVKRILRKYGYPPDKQEKATQTVLEQAALLSEEWATS